MIEISPLWLLAPLMLATAAWDLRFLRIPHTLVALILILFAASVVSGGPPRDLWLRLAGGAAVFAVGYAMFVVRMMGGGDVKVMAALALFVPPTLFAEFLLTFSAALAVGMIAVQAARRLAFNPGSRWMVLRTRRRFPMGLSIGAAGLALPILPLLAG